MNRRSVEFIGLNVWRSVCEVTGHSGQGFIPQCVTVSKRGSLFCETKVAISALKCGRSYCRSILCHLFNSDPIIIVYFATTGQFYGIYATLTQ